MGSSTQDLKIHPRHTYFRNFFERDGTIQGQTKAENLRIHKQTSLTVTPAKYLELLPTTMHKIKDEVSTGA